MEASRPQSSRTGWRSSLYGRIAVVFVLLVSGVLVAQLSVFLWLLQHSEQAPPSGLTQTLGVQLAASLEADPQFDLDRYVSTARAGQHLFVIMTDGRVRGSKTPQESVVRSVITDLNRPGGAMPSTWRNSQYRAVPLVVKGRTVGVLGIVPPTALEAFGLELAVIGTVVLLIGTVIAAMFIARPVRRRISDLEEAAVRLGGGDLEARAREEGRDEVARLARTFNRMASELARHAAELEASDRARRQLLADVSHELMTPLTAVLGHLETLMMPEVHLNDAGRLKYLSIAVREARRLERLIGDLLDTARLEAGGGDLYLQNVSVDDLFDRVVAHHECECLTRHIELVRSVGPGAENVFGDPFRLEQALINVTANALRHSGDDSRIELVASRSGDGTVALKITDRGEGIPSDDVPLIFDRFYKARGSSGVAVRGSGSGLGLSIVKAIVTRHGGRASASSVLGQGTTIQLDLPAGRTDLEGSGRSIA